MSSTKDELRKELNDIVAKHDQKIAESNGAILGAVRDVLKEKEAKARLGVRVLSYFDISGGYDKSSVSAMTSLDKATVARELLSYGEHVARELEGLVHQTQLRILEQGINDLRDEIKRIDEQIDKAKQRRNKKEAQELEDLKTVRIKI